MLATNDPATPTTTVALRGLGTLGTGGTNEPSLQWILDTLDIKVNVGDPDPTDNAMPDGNALLGDEVDMPSFTKLLFDRKVGITPLSLFGPAGPSGNTNVAIVAAHKSSDPTDAHSSGGAVQRPEQPEPDRAARRHRHVGEWTCDDAFGFDFTWPAFSNRVGLERGRPQHLGRRNQHKVRVYPLKDAAGSRRAATLHRRPRGRPDRRRLPGRRVHRAQRQGPGSPPATASSPRRPRLVFTGVRGTTTATQQVTLTNTGTTPLVHQQRDASTGTDAGVVRAHRVPTPPARSPVGGSVTVRRAVQARRLQHGRAHSAALQITSDDPDTPDARARPVRPGAPPVSRATTSRRSRPSSTPSATRSTSAGPV